MLSFLSMFCLVPDVEMNSKAVLRHKLKTQFGYDNFKSDLQKEATEAIYRAGKDVYICMPSGFGKSLCFQLPVLAKDNSFAIIISPTLSHAKNQVNYLKSMNVLAYSWSSHTPKDMKTRIKNDMTSKDPKMKLLYITPEQCTSSHFKFKLTEIQPNVLFYFVIDEAHYLSPLSHEFKTHYRKLAEVRLQCPNVPFIAVTSTATKEVRKDILKTLNMKDPLVFSMPIFRPNLFYDTWFMDVLPDPLTHLKQFIEESIGAKNALLPKEQRNCGIIFCDKQETTNSLSKILISMGIPTLFYHSRLKVDKRSSIQELWESGEINVIVATSSFGIGISKKSVRFVVHWCVPASMGNYYQESGRAGHDGKPSYCRIYYNSHNLDSLLLSSTQNEVSDSDNSTKQTYVQTKHRLFAEIKEILIKTECRHAAIAKYFGDPVPICFNCCDVCKDIEVVKERLSQLQRINQYNYLTSDSSQNSYLYQNSNSQNDFTLTKSLEEDSQNVCNYKHDGTETPTQHKCLNQSLNVTCDSSQSLHQNQSLQKDLEKSTESAEIYLEKSIILPDEEVNTLIGDKLVTTSLKNDQEFQNKILSNDKTRLQEEMSKIRSSRINKSIAELQLQKIFKILYVEPIVFSESDDEESAANNLSPIVSNKIRTTNVDSNTIIIPSQNLESSKTDTRLRSRMPHNKMCVELQLKKIQSLLFEDKITKEKVIPFEIETITRNVNFDSYESDIEDVIFVKESESLQSKESNIRSHDQNVKKRTYSNITDVESSDEISQKEKYRKKETTMS